MCGRNTYFAGEFSDLRLIWNVDSIPLLKPRFNIAPGQEAPVIFQADGKRSIELFQWGLIQSWAKDPAIGNKMINARAETLTEKPSFKRLSLGSQSIPNADKESVSLLATTASFPTVVPLWIIEQINQGSPDGRPRIHRRRCCHAPTNFNGSKQGRDRLWKRMKKAAYSEKSGTLASD
jgi:hypothetical protein